MRRRVLLSAMAGRALAGCLGSTEPTDDERSNDGASTEDDRPDGDDSPDPFGLPADETEFEGIVNGDVDRVVTTAAFDPDEAPIYLHRSPAESDLPADVTFALENGSGEGFQFGPYHTVVWKIVDGEWYHVAPQVWEDLAAVIDPGDVYDWSFALTEEDPVAAGISGRSRVDGLGGGEYVFTIDGWLPTTAGSRRFGFAAFFDLHGDPVALTPTPDAYATRDGETVYVTTDRLKEGERTRAEFVVERLSPEEARSVDDEPFIAEQLLRPRRYATGNLLRNGLAHSEDGVEVVRQRGWSDASPPFGLVEHVYPEYEGDTYRVSVEEFEDG